MLSRSLLQAAVVLVAIARWSLGGAGDALLATSKVHRPLLPLPGARYVYSTARLPFVGAQTSAVTFLRHSRVKLDMRGAMNLDGVYVSYTVDPITGQISYHLPQTVRTELARLRTTLLSAAYFSDGDVVRVRVKPPIVPAIEMTHRRAA